MLDEINKQGVSIIIGARNEYPQVAMTITNLMEDCLNSGITNFELILMDNGSEDETSRFFAWKPINKQGRWRYQYSPRGMVHSGRLRIFYDPVLSNVGTRNKGVLKAKYENIIFSDAHVIVRPGSILSMLKTLNEFNGGVIHSGVSWMGADGTNPKSGYQYSYKVGEKIWGCVDQDTELLTFYGWKKYNEVDENSLFATINTETKNVEYQKPQKITRQEFSGFAIEIKNNNADMLLTEDHRTLVDDFNVIPAGKVLPENVIPTYSNGYFSEMGNVYDDAFVAVLGWVLTDGGYDYKEDKYPRVRIFQKKSTQSTIIEKDLTESGLNYFKFQNKAGKNIWTLESKVSKKIIDMFPDRKLHTPFVSLLSCPQARIMLDRMMLADGSNKTFYKTDKEFVNAFQMLCVHAGKPCKYIYKKPSAFRGNRYGKRGIYNVYIDIKKHSKLKISKRKYSGIMWCPTVPNGTIIARRNGKVYYTGQTWNSVAVADKPFYIPLCGHCFLAVKKSQFLDFRGYPYAQRVYGGGEPYLDTKYWMLGSHAMCDPNALVYHLSAGRGYAWDNADLIHNMLLVSYILGGDEWIDRIYITYLNKPGVRKEILDILYNEAKLEGEADKRWLDENKKISFEDLLELPLSRKVQAMSVEEKKQTGKWCDKCTKRGRADPHIMRIWDYKNEQLYGNHRSWVVEFELKKKDGGIYIGNTHITNPIALEIASMYF